jgi:hypothetical protein
MAKALGIVCAKDVVLLAVAKDGRVVSDSHEKLDAAQVLEETERLQAMQDDVGRVLAEVWPAAVRILMPEPTYKDSYARIAARSALETVVRLACLRHGIAVEMLDRRSARSRLGIARKGRLEDHVPEIVEPIGKYWSAGRNLAALAALAEKS